MTYNKVTFEFPTAEQAQAFYRWFQTLGENAYYDGIWQEDITLAVNDFVYNNEEQIVYGRGSYVPGAAPEYPDDE
jgi:hypothetical protein